jgi:Domain of unknown function (DUF222)
MVGQIPDDSPDAGEPTRDGSGRLGFGWLPGSAEAGTVPEAWFGGSGPSGAGSAGAGSAGGGSAGGGSAGGGSAGGGSAGGGLTGGGGCGDGAWPRGLDWQALLGALAAAGIGAGTGGDQEAVLAEELEAAARGPVRPLPAGQLAALAAEHMIPGPAQAGWLGVAAGASGVLDEDALAGVAVAARRLASWAQAAELAAVAQLAARAAAADPKIGVAGDGRPGRLGQDAVSQVSLALTLSDYSAGSWADLAVTLRWRLPATGQALACGRIDVHRARLIAEATSVLDEETARAVEAKVLPDAGGLVAGELRARLRRAVIAADPEGAEQRRQQAERHAKVSLYGDDDGTATLTGSKLPVIEAAAAMARITALARAMKAAGQAGGLDLHRARVMLGLLLGTLPYIPPANGAPPDRPPPSGGNEPSSGEPSGTGGPSAGESDEPGGPGGGEPGGPACPAGPGANSTGRPHDRIPDPGDGGPWGDRPDPRDEDAPDDDPDEDGWVGDEHGACEGGGDDLTGATPEWPALGVIPPGLARHPGAQPGGGQPWSGRPGPGLLDVTLPWAVLAGWSSEPGTLGRIGPVTAIQARQLAQAAETDPAAQWRIIITNSAGQAIAVTRIRRRTRDGPGPARDSPARDSPARDSPARDSPARDSPARDDPLPGVGLVGRVTLTISQDLITSRQQTLSRPRGPGSPGRIAATAFRAAARALAQALARAAADEAAGGCAHQDESPAYRPPPRLREYITARDVTCRFPPCRQPAWRADLDHTRPWDDGGRSCRCNFGGGCRRHHQLKQHPRWRLEQIRPGVFSWTTPAGRIYTTGPDTQPA